MSFSRRLPALGLLSALSAPAGAVLVDIVVDGAVSANQVTLGPYAGVAPGTPVRLTVRIDTTNVFSDEPEIATTWYNEDYDDALFEVQGVPTADGLPSANQQVIFAGSDFYYQIDAPAVRLDLAQTTLVHCQFDGFNANPFNNTGHLEENFGTYPAAVFDSLQHFRVLVIQPGPVLREMTLIADTFTIRAAATAVCGDGNLDPGEQCDDGNLTDGDGCDSACAIEPSCGDGRLDPGETCDDGNLVNGDGCDAECQLECGNGVLDPDEECDDGNRVNGDGCDSLCEIEPGCGNGRIDAGEECDDGNAVSGDGCDSACQFECGNGLLQPGEACDDGNRLNGDGCNDACQPEFTCGNGALELGEQCDDGNTAGGDGCSATCQMEVVCGNGRVELGEQCDDGNADPDDGCDACQTDLDPTLCTDTEDFELHAPTPQELGHFGTAVELDGDRLLVGYQGKSAFAGAALIYQWQDGAWQFDTELPRPIEPGENLGGAVALKGHVAAAGALGTDTPVGPNRGAVHVWSDRSGDWLPEGLLYLSADLLDDQTTFFPTYNESIAITGDTIFAAADAYSPGGIFGGLGSAGAVFFWKFDGSAWQYAGRILTPDVAPNQRFGESVDADGDLLVVGAEGSAGQAAYIYRRAGGQWKHEKKLTIPPTAFQSGYGDSVAVSGDTVAVASPSWSSTISLGPGAVWVYRFVGAAWTLEEQILPIDGSIGTIFGTSIDLDGDTLIVGAEFGGPLHEGALHVYRRFGSDWLPAGRMAAANGRTADMIGRSVSLSGGRAAVGGEFRDVGPLVSAGAVFMFDVADNCQATGPDIDADGDVDLDDLLLVLGNFGQSGPNVTGDADGDDDVDLDDLLLVLGNFGA